MPTVTLPSEKPGSEIAMHSDNDSDQKQISKAKAWEESWPYLLGALATGAYWITKDKLPLSPNFKEGLVAVASLAGILAAFFVAAAAILVTLGDSWFKRRAIESGVYLSLIGYMLTAMGWTLATAVITTAGIFFDSQWHLYWYRYAMAAWAFLTGTTLGVSIRVLRIFAVLMKYIARY